MLVPPANNVLTRNSSVHKILNIIEGLFGVLTVILMVVLINKGEGSNSNLYIGLAVLFLADYYISWILYYNGVVAPWLLILGIACMLAFVFLFRRTLDEKLCSPRSMCCFWNYPYFYY